MATHDSFTAAAQGRHGDFTVDVIAVTNLGGDGQTLMTICTQDYPIYITKAQAMEFFNLVPKE